MKKFCLALFLLVAISVTSANAQTPMSFSVQGGYSWSIGVLGAEAQFGNIGLFLATVLGLPNAVIVPIVIIYSIILLAVVGSMFSAVILNNLRIRKIRKILGIGIVQYNILADLYL